MAGFKTHITVSSVLGVGLGGTACLAYGVPWPTCVLAGGLCSVSGMLPDIDSDSGRPFHESMAFAASVVPMMLLPHFQRVGMSHESIVLSAATIYIAIRFGVAWLLKRYTVHRGMFHSLPAAAVFGEIVYLMAAGEDTRVRLFKAGAVVLGFVSHLLLDELYSIEWRHGHLRLKSSFGTALKLFGQSGWANLSAYGKLAILAAAIFFEAHGPQQQHPTQGIDSVQQSASRIMDQFFKR